MKLINTTSLDTDYLYKVVMYCMPKGLTRKDVNEVSFGNTRLGFHGRAWCLDMRTSMGIPKKVQYKRPVTTGGMRGYLPIKLYSWDEHLVELVSHELRHIWQYKNDKKLPREIKKIRRYNMGTRAHLLEVDASLYAKRMVRMYRRSLGERF